MRLGISEFPDRGIGYYERFEATFNNGLNRFVACIGHIYLRYPTAFDLYTQFGQTTVIP